MRIGLTCTTIEPKLAQGKIDGIGVYTQSLYDQLQQLGQDVIPYSYSKHSLNTSSFPNGQLFPLSYLRARALSWVPLASQILYKGIKKNIDLLHVTDHMIPQVTQVPMIATIHDTLMFQAPQWNYSYMSAFKNALRKRSTHWVKHFITISNAMVPDLIEHLNLREQQISVVHNGISNWWFETVSEEEKKQVLKKYSLPDKILLHTGTLQPRKNVPRIIEAYLQLPKDIRDEYPLVIVGRAGWNMDETLAAIKKLTDQQSGCWLNHVSNEELRTLFQSSTLYLIPSLHEGFGYTILEAFASRAAVITSNVAAMPETAGNAAHLVDPLSVSELQSAMLNLLTNETLRCQYIEKGVIRSKDFSLEKCARETLEVYKKII